jgi:hypothetical protein
MAGKHALLIAAIVAISRVGSADPSTPAVRQVQQLRLGEGVPVWLEIAATSAFVVIDTARDGRHERTYLTVPLGDLNRAPGYRVIFERLVSAFDRQASIGIVWSEAPDHSTPGPEWRKPEGHTYFTVQSVFPLVAQSTDAYRAPARVVTPRGELKK